MMVGTEIPLKSFMPMLKRILSLVLVLALTAGFAPCADASAYDAHPKLVVILVIDQFREDYLERYRADFSQRACVCFLSTEPIFPIAITTTRIY